MAVPRKLVVVPNAATRELWRIAETGETDELDAVLSRADVNARNEHGMTALMRAAYHGRVQLVRVLLEHGADPNVVRNDNFTALSLAAFFGHAEIVDLLMRHGAKTDVATRFGTSPEIWARARSFGDVARSLERKQEFKKSVVEKPVLPPREPVPVLPPRDAAPQFAPEPVTAKPVTSAVRTLHDPPEIWDLVQEAPRNFNARSAFMARMGWLNATLTTVLVLLVVVGGGFAATFFFKQRVRPSSVSGVPAPAAATTAPVPAPVTVSGPVTNQPVETPNAVPETPPVATAPANPQIISNPISSRSRSFSKSRVAPIVTNNDEQPAAETAAAPPSIAPPKTEPRPAVQGDTKKSSPPVNSQIIAPKTQQSKAKVIQWP